MEKQTIEKGTVKKPPLEACLPLLGISVATISPDLCDAGSSGLQRKISGGEQSSKPNVALKRSQCIAIDSEPGDCETDTEKIVWLKTCRVQLSKAGRMTLIAFGCQLNDKHITLAQKLLQNRFPNVEGFAPMLMQTKKGQSKITSGIQIIFCHGNHWIAVSNVRSPGDIIIYDSLHVSISEEVKEIVSSLFSHDDLYHWLQCISKNLDPTIVVSLL